MNNKDRGPVIIGTRRSKLARWQTDYVVAKLREAWPELDVEVRLFVTEGDAETGIPLARMGGRGVFTSQLESALAQGDIDVAVHSLKDLPTEENPALVLAAISEREDPRDCMVSRGGVALRDLPQGARVGTSSTRREAQIRAIRPDLVITSIRGNVETRIRKVREGDYDATLLAAAGMRRLGLADEVSEWLPLGEMLPAPGQASLGIQCRSDDERVREILAVIDDPVARRCVTAERAFLEQLGGGCSLPIAAMATADGDTPTAAIRLKTVVVSPDGKDCIRVEGTGDDPVALGTRLAGEAIERGALRVLEAVEEAHQLLPLAGKRIVVTRAAHQSRYLCERLKQLGATALVIPAIQVLPPDDTTPVEAAIDRIATYDWIVFTSANAVEMFSTHLETRDGTLAGRRVAAVGPATQAALARHDIEADFVPTEFVGDAIIAGLGAIEGARFLLPRADIARESLPQRLRESGGHVDDIVVYRTVPAELGADQTETLRDGVDAITFTSGSTARNFAAAVRQSDLPASVLEAPVIACIGPVTAREAAEAGLRVDTTAESYTAEGLVEALVRHFAKK